ncbi:MULTISPECIES: GntR family transcriptional regulator [unclassified Caulobacter]|jgi:DNA-binding GntR family transcriptional regulator|uniref:GntR family transcriptional regulator n=1 Tax=unclassified Caulobacter TaxID=2648921 RepID=UPI000786579A|nr:MULTISPECIES: GntR family transcriptional regulator [unclassified Caulobacter]AZS21817.1 GntR family transcriptional regulator [Caulobacter sp. FWC26]
MDEVGSSAPPRVRRKSDQTLDARLSETLIREIIDNHYPPGAWLREQEVSARHGVSRASVREALRSVARAGFVEMQPWRGAQVVSVGSEELLDIFSLLEEMYAQCARLSAQRFPERLIPRLDGMLEAIEAAVTRDADRAELYALSFGLGQLVGRYSGSVLAYRMLTQVGNLALWQQRLLQPGTSQSEQQSLSAHRILVSAVKDRHPEIAAAAARMIVMITRRSLASALHLESVHK